ncbi:MAG: 3'(2'),5'-bisphosphate nucleotidase CysQ [Flavobacteriales bacterium]|jgi:3'(2'), 5'-bisphosphate nucleotidase|tara:strand:+ start:7456 stop:8259 length:804 start_codon:yes stop_codon:yes gene_type:complete
MTSIVPDFEMLLELAKNAALQAGKEILKVYNSDDFGVESKSDESPLTKADKAAHYKIVELLEDSNLPILSEEGTEVPFEERSKWGYFWMVDPLDGTKEFIKRNGEFTVNIALIHKGSPVMGIVYTPVVDELFYAHNTIGAYKVDSLGVHKLNPSAPENLTGLRVVASRSHLNEETKSFMDQLLNPAIVSMGSSLKFLAIADSKADVYPRYAPTMEWDSAAAHGICKVLGIEVLNLETNEPVSYNKENLLNPYFIVGATDLLRKLDLK